MEPTKLTFGEWLDRWLKVYAKPKVRPTTFDCYEENIRLYLNPALGHVLLRELRPEHLQAPHNEKLSEGLSSRTVRLIHTVAHAALKQAVKSGLVARRLCKLAGIERANLHSLRHTFATRLLEANEHPKAVQELLRDSQISVVLDLYSHVSMDLNRRARERLDQELKKKALAQEGQE